MKTKVLFICHGNICRSPMAEFILKKMIDDNPELKAKGIIVDSAAVSREEIGNDIYPPAKKSLSSHGVPFESRRARQMTSDDYANYDCIYIMDESNRRLINRIIGMDSMNKVKLLLPEGVSDPWYTRDFETCYRDIEKGCRRVIDELQI